MDDLLSVADSAKLLGVSPRMVRYYVQCGRLHAIRMKRPGFPSVLLITGNSLNILNSENKILSGVAVHDFAKAMKISTSRIRQLIREGRIEARKIGGRWAILDLPDDWLIEPSEDVFDTYSVSEYAEILGVSDRWVRELISRGSVKADLVNGAWRIKDISKELVDQLPSDSPLRNIL